MTGPETKVRDSDKGLNWDMIGVAVNAISAAAVVGTLIFAVVQISDTRTALQANTLYGVEKDFVKIFDPISTPDFQHCFGKQSNIDATIKLSNPCLDPTQRQHLYDILAHYRLLLDLEEHHSLESEYVSRRFQGGCGFLTTQGTQDTISEFEKKGAIDPRLKARINQECTAAK
jgi:hypothetical protein